MAGMVSAWPGKQVIAMHKTIAILAFLLLLSPASLLAASERITVTHTYMLGDSESRNEARASCLAEAKRKIAEQAGAYVEVLSKTKNFQMDSDEVLSFTAALVRVTVEDETFVLENGSLMLTLKVTGEVDPEAVQRRLDELAEQRLALRAESKSLLQAKEKPLLQEQTAVGPLPEQQETPAAAEGDGAEQDAVAHSVPRAKDPRAAKRRLQQSLEATTQLCAELTEPGMTRGEVEHLLGSPRAVKRNQRYNYLGAKYGHIWVVFRDDVVACVRSRLEYRRNAGGEAHCEGFAANFVTR